ncbi:MAG TPA: polysaccharide biosynthesis tyrosine autokinase, partial [Blastocatellia bacterium]|nr:polysaccharide biosynthesis tyrosine autokinase [Blastocatellia bacterium]
MNEDKKEVERPLTQEETAIIRPFTVSRPGSRSSDYGYGYGYGEGADSDQGIHLREVWRVIRKRKWLVMVIAAITTIALTIEVYRTPSIYRAETIIEITKDSATVVKTDAKVIEIDDSDNINTNKIIFKSRPLLEDIVVRLQLDQNSKFIESLHKKSILSSLKDIGSRLSGGSVGEKPKPIEAPVSAQLAVLNERTPEESQRLGPYVNILRNKLNVDAEPGTHVLHVSFDHTDPALASAIVNASANNFISRSFERKTARFSGASDWLVRSTRELKSKVEQAEQALADYTRRNGIFSGDGKESLTTDKLSALHSQATKAETDRMLKQSLYDDVLSGRVEQLPEAFADPKTSSLQGELGKLLTEEAELNTKFGPDNPRLAAVKSKIASLRQQMNEARFALAETLKANFERALRDERSLKVALDRAKAEALQENQASVQYSILKSDVDTAKALYDDFLRKTKQADLELAEQHNNLRVIEPAEIPTSPVGPMRFRTILIGLLVSLVGGMGLAFFLEYLDNTVKSVEDVVRVAQLPTLAVIPSITTISHRALTAKKRGKYQLVNITPPLEIDTQTGDTGSLSKITSLDKLSSVVEAYRMLRTSVLLSAAGNPPKIILFTSGQPGEGKTTTAINTAISLSQLGLSVLLIDADLRRPTIHRAFKMNQQQGLSTYLSRSVEVEPLIHKLWIPNLSVLPCGPIPPNPAELISSERMKEV